LRAPAFVPADAAVETLRTRRLSAVALQNPGARGLVKALSPGQQPAFARTAVPIAPVVNRHAAPIDHVDLKKPRLGRHGGRAIDRDRRCRVGVLRLVQMAGRTACAAALAATVAASVANAAGGPRALPSHAPTGLVYATATGISATTSRIWRARSDGSDPVFITNGSSPQLSPDGRWIAFVRTRQRPLRSQLLLVAASGGRPRLLQQVEGRFFDAPVWAPNSRALVAVDDGGPVKSGGLILIDLRPGRRVLFARARRLSAVVSPSFSPDAREIAYAREGQTGADLYVYSVPARTTRQITHDHQSIDPNWGPTWIAYNRGGFNHAGDVWLIHADGRAAHRLTQTNAGLYPAAWAADGKRLLAAYPAMHNGRLWAVELPSGHSRPLTGWVGDLFPQGLSRDGSTVLAAIGCGGLVSPYGTIETLPFAGGKPKVIVTGPCRASWNR
jgi:dipeptidyl aminopeptidase/acylaminoacyl peptidase